MYRIVVGARGDLAEGWNYDAYAQYGTVLFQNEFRNEFSLRRSSNALINEGGQCRVNVDADFTNDDPGCVPLDVFSETGPTQEMLAYVTASGLMEGTTKQQVVSGAVNGDLAPYNVRIPWAEDAVRVAFGTEYRREESEVRPDSAFCPGTARHGFGPPRSRQHHVPDLGVVRRDGVFWRGAHPDRAESAPHS